MRLVFLLAFGMLVLPLSGCAKKEKDESSTTNSNQNDSTQDNEVAEEEATEEAGDGEMNEGKEEYPEEGMPEEVADAELNSPNASGHAEPPEEGASAELTTPEDAEYGEPPEAGASAELTTPEDAEYGEPPAEPEGTTPDDPEFTESEYPEEGNPPEGEEGLEGDSPELTDSENPEGIGEGEGVNRQSVGIPEKPTDIRGVKEDTAVYAAVDLLLKIGRGESEGLKELIAEDADEMLSRLRSEPEKTFEEAQEIIGRWKPISSRGDNRDTIIYFLNNKNKVLQVFVRRIQGKYRVRELREREAAKKNRRRR